MQLFKNTGFLIIALIIDLTQAGISAGLSVIAAFPVTAIGGGTGCALGGYFLGQVGCWLGGTTLAVFGSLLNPFLAGATVPAGIMFGFAINMCLSFVGGAFLILTMTFFKGHVSWNRLFLGTGELVPGINNIPFWTFFVLASAWDGATTRKARKNVMGLASIFLQPARAAMSMKEGALATLEHAREQGERWNEPVSIPNPVVTPQPTSAVDLVRTADRITLQDVRPAKPNAKLA